MYKEEVGMGRVKCMRIESSWKTVKALQTLLFRDIDEEIGFFLFIRTQEEDTIGM
jgi:hypothetical protein